MTDRVAMKGTSDPSVTDRGYVNPDVLVSTDWMADHLNEDWIRIVESDEDVLLYDIGHIPGAVKIDWQEDLQDPTVRDFIDSERFAKLMERLGVDNDTTIVFYGDKNNWWAAYAYWFFDYMGHSNMRIMDGGRKKWEAEGRPLTRDVPKYQHTSYSARPMRPELRAFREEVLDHIGYKGRQKVGEGKPLVDVRSPGEYSGELLHMPDYPQEGALRGGHIPGAKNIPWGRAVNDDGTFKPANELIELYSGQGVTGAKEIVTYCRIGERSAHSWFVLHELLGYPSVKNYDGSWTEWGNIIGVPIER
jgi:thiosulfate/3-mercaptopyruvate sulfurtransferase